MANTPKEPPKNFIDALNEQEAAKKQDQNRADELQAINKAGIKNVEATNRTTEAVGKGAAAIKAGVKITNSDLAKSGDVSAAVDAINKMNLTTFTASQNKYADMAQNMLELADSLKTVAGSIQNNSSGLDTTLESAAKRIQDVVKELNNVNTSSNKDVVKALQSVTTAVKAINVQPQVTVDAPKVTVPTPRVTVNEKEVDFQPVLDKLDSLRESLDDKDEDQAVITAVSNVQRAIESLSFPVPNYVLPFKDSNGKAIQAQLDSNGNLPTVGGSLPSALVNGQKSVTSVASALASNALTQGVILESLSTNTVSIFIGGNGVTATTGIELLPGGSTSAAVNNTNVLYAITASSTATLTFMGS